MHVTASSPARTRERRGLPSAMAGSVRGVSMPPSEESLEAAYPGARLGLPARGPGAVAGWGRRFLALALDWVASMLVAGLFIGTAVWSGRGAEQWLTMLVFL